MGKKKKKKMNISKEDSSYLEKNNMKIGYSIRFNAYIKNQKLLSFKSLFKKDDKKLLSWSNLMELRGDEIQNSAISFMNSPPLSDIDNKDPLSTHEYVNDIISHRQSIEFFYSAPNNYMTRQVDITEKMREILVDWLIEVHLKFKLIHETLYLTISCIDRYLAVSQINRKNLQLVGITAMLISSKYEDILAPMVSDFVYISDKTYSCNQILIMEKRMLNALNFQLTVLTTYFFLQSLLKTIKADKDVSMLSQYLIELALVDYYMLNFPCSLIAATAVYIANKYMLKEDCWNYTMEKYSFYSLEKFKLCMTALVRLHYKATIISEKAVYKKFCGKPFNEVAKIQQIKLDVLNDISLELNFD